MKRIIIMVKHAPKIAPKAWMLHIAHAGLKIYFQWQHDAIDVARQHGRGYKSRGMLAELLIKKRDGTFSSRGSSYGKDPRETKG